MELYLIFEISFWSFSNAFSSICLTLSLLIWYFLLKSSNFNGFSLSFLSLIISFSLSFKTSKAFENKNELDYRRNLFSKAFEVLNEREKEIIKLRKLSENPLKLEDLSKKYKISRERVRQIEEKALEKLQKEISNIR